MFPVPFPAHRRAKFVSALTVVAWAIAVAAAPAQSVDAVASNTAGRIEFGEANLPPATVEVDLGPEVFSDLFGLGDAAIAGVAETLAQSAGAQPGADGTRMAAEQLAAARQIIELAREVVHEVRVRVYDGFPDEAQPEALISSLDQQLSAHEWDTIVRIRDGEDTVRVSLLRVDGAVRGAFVVAGDGSDLVLANVVCDVSPENIKKLTTAATKIGLDNGLGQVIEAKMKKVHGKQAPWSSDDSR